MQEKSEDENNPLNLSDLESVDSEDNMETNYSDKPHSMLNHPASKHFPFSRRPSQALTDHSDDDRVDTDRFISIEPQSAQVESAGPSSSRQSLPRSESPNLQETQLGMKGSYSDSDESDELGNTKKKRVAIPGEYNPGSYDDLEVSNDIKEVFQYITKYVPQQLALDYKFKPFVPEFIPAVGDIDAFLKIVPPQKTLSGNDFKAVESHLGLTVLDEPVANQSDPALLYLKLRAASITVSHTNESMVVKKIDDVEKNSKIIDKWIKDVSELHRNKSTTIVKYSEPMPDVDDLLQEWPEQFETSLKQYSIPNPKFGGSLSEYINILCAIFDIPIYKNKIESLHVLFSLFIHVKNAQMYPTYSDVNIKEITKSEPDHLVLD
ncbi:hypothetical protein PPYR_04855 [Photinus pyralis]|uniref:Intraflagellar transport protein 46 homolog n=2 Tax=Photinus pyralis TaxID=7054 RepID=A0A5N4AZA3_PHOPY|nr:intraflagellar transport protein 46 homolog [Photinus pyralis]KAB0802669.1 hypothetical protein PPYR_04855 [Photinus pyralis]